MATEEELFQQIQGFSTPQIPADKLAEFARNEAAVKEAQAKVDRYDTLAAALSGASQGLTFSFGDEAVAGLRSLFGGSSYQDELANEAAMRQRIMETQPGVAIGSEIAAGLGTGLLGAGVAAPGLASKLLLGATGKATPTIGQLAAIGAAQGGLVGAGSAQPGERLAGSAIGAGTGALLGGALGKGSQLASEYVLQPFFTQAALGGAERGAVGLGGKPAFTAQEMQLAKILSETAPEAIPAAEQALIRAGELGKPLFIPEAVQSPSLFQEAKFIANYPASIEIAQKAIEGRAADATARITQSLDVISPQRNVTAAANKLVQGAKSLLDELGIARKEATKGLYDAAFEKTPQLTKDESIKLITENPRIQGAIKAVRKELPELASLPDSSTEVLHQAQQYLAGKARAVKNKYTSRKIQDARNALMKAIKNESPDYGTATETFAKMSKGLTSKEQSKIGFLANVSPDKPGTIGRVFALDADTIASLRDDFIQAGKLEDWESGVRSYLQRAVDAAPDERNPINKLIDSPALRAKLQAALGNKFDKIIEPLTVEQTILKGQRKYFAGSPTAPLLQREQAVEESIGAIQKAMQFMKNPVTEGGKMLSKVLGGNKKPEFYEGYARLLFSAPEQGLETIGKVRKLTEALRNTRTAAGKVGAVTGTTAGREPATGFKAIEETKSSKKSDLLSVGGVGAAAMTSPEVDDLFNQIQGFETSSNAPKANVKVGKQEISALLDEIPREFGINPKWVKAIAQVESNFNPDAVGPKTKYGQAEGLVQLMPATAKALGVKNSFDPKQAITGASKLLVELDDTYGKYKEPMLLFAAYNSRPEVVNAAIRKVKKENKPITWENVSKYMPKETQRYVDKVLSLI